jgi:hypothetical protein
VVHCRFSRRSDRPAERDGDEVSARSGADFTQVSGPSQGASAMDGRHLKEIVRR